LGVEPLLPHLKLTAVLMIRLRIGQQIQEPAPLLGLDLRQQAMRGEFLQIGHHPRKLLALHHRVKVIVHDHPCIQAQPLLLAAEVQRLSEDVTAGRQNEQRQPVLNGGSDEMRAFLLTY